MGSVRSMIQITNHKSHKPSVTLNLGGGNDSQRQQTCFCQVGLGIANMQDHRVGHSYIHLAFLKKVSLVKKYSQMHIQ